MNESLKLIQEGYKANKEYENTINRNSASFEAYQNRLKERIESGQASNLELLSYGFSQLNEAKKEDESDES